MDLTDLLLLFTIIINCIKKGFGVKDRDSDVVHGLQLLSSSLNAELPQYCHDNSYDIMPFKLLQKP